MARNEEGSQKAGLRERKAKNVQDEVQRQGVTGCGTAVLRRPVCRQFLKYNSANKVLWSDFI